MSVTVSVSSDSSNPTHHVSLVPVGGSTTIGLNIKGFPNNFRQYPYSPSSLQFNVGRQGYSSFEAPYSSIDQTDWTGGFGQEQFEDTSKFLDSYNAWTLSDKMWMPAPLARFTKGLRKENHNLPGATQLLSDTASRRVTSVKWQSLTGSYQYCSLQFTAYDSYSVGEIWLLLRYFGAPGQLNIGIYTDTSNKPNAVISDGSIDIANDSAERANALPEGKSIGQWVICHFDTAPSLTDGSTKYHIVVGNTESADPTVDYWQIGYMGQGGYSGAKNKSSDGSTWSSTFARAFFYRVTEAITDAKIHFVEYKNAVYACTEPLNGGAGKIYLNGDRGIATGTSTADKLVDSTKSWTANQWINTYLHIWNGKGQGQRRRIVDNTTTELIVYDSTDDSNVGVGKPFDITPIQGGTDVGSEYVIVGTDQWGDVTPTGSATTITKPITDVYVLWGVMYCCQGEEANVVKIREYNDNGSPGVWKDFWGANAQTNGTNVIDDAAFKALFLTSTYDPVNENFMWRARNEAPAEWTGTNQTSVRKADDVTWSANPDFTAFNTVPIGTRDHLITGITVYNGILWVGKEDSLWYVDNDGSYDRAYPLQIGLEAMAEPHNFRAMMAKDLYLYFNWAHSVERLYGSTLDDIGPWKGLGLPERARGPVVELIPAIGWIFAAVDGDFDGQSSLLAYNGRGWHNLFRGTSRLTSDFVGQKNNPRIRSAHWQSVSGEHALNWIWFEYGGDIMGMRMPRKSLNPSLESNFDMAHDSFVTSSVHSANYPELEKYFKRVTVVSPNFRNVETQDIFVDYISEPNVHNFSNPSWTEVSDTTGDPSFTFDLSQSRKRNIIIRTRILLGILQNPTSSAAPPEIINTGAGGSGPCKISAVVLDAFSRKPVKYNWEMKIDLSDNRNTITGEIDHTQDTIMDQLTTWSGQAQAITFRCVDNFADDSGSGRTVVVEPPTLLRSVWNKIMRLFKGTAVVTLREL